MVSLFLYLDLSGLGSAAAYQATKLNGDIRDDAFTTVNNAQFIV